MVAYFQRLLLASLLIGGLLSPALKAAPNPTPTPKPSLIKTIPAAVIATNNTNGLIIDLTKCFKAPPAPDDVVRVTTTYGGFNVQLFPSNAPITVSNFLSYVNDGAYENTLIHRVPTSPAHIIETGAYTLDSYLSPIAVWAPITNEASLSNTTGTVATLPRGGPDNATSEWIINLTNNTALDPANTTNACTVFGQILGDGIQVANQIAATPAWPLASYETNPIFAPFTSIPLRGITYFYAGYPLSLANFLSITHVMTLPYFAFSSDPSAFSTEIQGTNLVVKFQSYGTSNVTITAYAADTNGNFVKSAFAVAPSPKGSQTITFPTNPPQPYSTNPYTFNDGTNYPTSTSGMEVSVKIKSGPAKIAKDQFYFTGVGTVTMIASQSGNNNYNAAANVLGTVVVLKANQTITPFNLPAFTNVVKFPTAFTLTNAPKASSGLAVKLVASGPAKLSGTKVTLTGTGTITLTAGQVGNAKYNPAPNQSTNFVVGSK